MRILIVAAVWLSALTAYADDNTVRFREGASLTVSIFETRGVANEVDVGRMFASTVCAIDCPSAQTGFIDGAFMSLDIKDPNQLNLLFSNLVGKLVVDTSTVAGRGAQSLPQYVALQNASSGGTILDAGSSVPAIFIGTTSLLLIAIGATVLVVAARTRRRSWLS